MKFREIRYTTKMERDYSKKVYIFSISDSMGVIVVGSGETRLKAKRDAKENLKTYLAYLY